MNAVVKFEKLLYEVSSSGKASDFVKTKALIKALAEVKDLCRLLGGAAEEFSAAVLAEARVKYLDNLNVAASSSLKALLADDDDAAAEEESKVCEALRAAVS